MMSELCVTLTVCVLFLHLKKKNLVKSGHPAVLVSISTYC